MRFCKTGAKAAVEKIQAAADLATLLAVQSALQVADHVEGMVDEFRTELDVALLHGDGRSPQILDELFVEEDDQLHSARPADGTFAICRSWVHDFGYNPEVRMGCETPVVPEPDAVALGKLSRVSVT